MPKNKLIYYGILIVAATALLWVGYQITNVALMILPWTGGIGALTIVAGLFTEMQRSKALQERRRERLSQANQTGP
jgi:hypothetical protein